MQVFPSPEYMLRLMGSMCAEQDENWSSRRYIAFESMLKLAEPAAPEPAESEPLVGRGSWSLRPRWSSRARAGVRDAMTKASSNGGVPRRTG